MLEETPYFLLQAKLRLRENHNSTSAEWDLGAWRTTLEEIKI